MANSKWQDIEREDLKYMYENGFKIREIAEVLGKSESAIMQEKKYMQLKSPRKHREKDGKIFCFMCKEFKEKSDFYKNSGNIRGYYSRCKECCKKINKEAWENRKLKKILEKEKEYIKTKEEINKGAYKRCNSCKEIKNVEEFNWYKKYIKIQVYCRECQKKATRKSELKRLEEKGY